MPKMVYRGDIYMADLSTAVGCEQGGKRPVLIVQNNSGNRHAKTTIIVPITTKIASKSSLPTHYILKNATAKIPRNSLVLAEQIRTIDKTRLLTFIGYVPLVEMNKIDKILAISIGMEQYNAK